MEEAVEIANETDYALAAGVWSSDVDAAFGLASRLDAGTVWINGMMTTWGYNCPFGGGKLTGSGRTNGREGLMQYLVPRAVALKLPAPAALRVPTAKRARAQ